MQILLDVHRMQILTICPILLSRDVMHVHSNAYPIHNLLQLKMLKYTELELSWSKSPAA